MHIGEKSDNEGPCSIHKVTIEAYEKRHTRNF